MTHKSYKPYFFACSAMLVAGNLAAQTGDPVAERIFRLGMDRCTASFFPPVQVPAQHRRSCAFDHRDQRSGPTRRHVAEPQVLVLHQRGHQRRPDDLAEHQRFGAQLYPPVQIGGEHVVFLGGGGPAGGLGAGRSGAARASAEQVRLRSRSRAQCLVIEVQL